MDPQSQPTPDPALSNTDTGRAPEQTPPQTPPEASGQMYRVPETPLTEPGEKSSFGIVIAILVILAILIIGGLYLWGQYLAQSEEDQGINPEEIINNDPVTEDLEEQSDSTEFDDIEQDLNASDFESLDSDFENIESEYQN